MLFEIFKNVIRSLKHFSQHAFGTHLKMFTIMDDR